MSRLCAQAIRRNRSSGMSAVNPRCLRSWFVRVIIPSLTERRVSNRLNRGEPDWERKGFVAGHADRDAASRRQTPSKANEEKSRETEGGRWVIACEKLSLPMSAVAFRAWKRVPDTSAREVLDMKSSQCGKPGGGSVFTYVFQHKYFGAS
jgi:hypothetical protein